jgi:uncharacterized protein YhdP
MRMAPLAETGPNSAAPARSWLRVALLGTLAVGAISALLLFAYELALARVPQHRAALERLVRAQTGLDVRFTELGLRWGWYGPEAVFRHVELDEPGSSEALLRAPELVVGFDAWRTLRSGHPEAGRIELIAPEIDFSSRSLRPGVGFSATGTPPPTKCTGPATSKTSGAHGSAAGTAAANIAGSHGSTAGTAAANIAGAHGSTAGTAAANAAGGLAPSCLASDGVGATSRVGFAATLESSALGRVAVLQRWRGGRIDIEGGTVRLPATSGASPLSVQIRRATLRRSDDAWNVAGLLFLPDRVGRSARVTMDVRGDLSHASALSGSLRVEAKRLLFPGSRDFLAALPEIARFLPRGGQGDMTVSLSFAQGEVVKAHGSVHAAGLVFDTLGGFGPAGARAGAGGNAVRDTGIGATADAAIAPARPNLLVLDRLIGNWKASRLGPGWRVRVDSLDLEKGDHFGSLIVDTSESSQSDSPGRWIRGTLDQAPLESVVAITQWLAPHVDLAGVHLDGTARNLKFDWASGRAEGQRLRTSAELEDVSLMPRSKDYVLGGLSARVDGSESDLTIDVQSRTARLELTQSQQEPLADVRVSSRLHVGSNRDGWKLETDAFVLEHQRASLNLSGSLQGGLSEPQILAKGTLTGADIPLVVRLLGDNTAEAFGAAASRLTAGRIQNAEFALRGSVSDLPFGGRHDGFTGSLTLRDAILSGGDLWPDADGIGAHVEWRGAQIQATIDAGRAGPFQLASAKAQWGADGQSATRLTGHVNGRLEDAIAWVHNHPQLQQYAPDVGQIDAKGDASFDFNVTVPPDLQYESGANAPTALTARSTRDVRGAPVSRYSAGPGANDVPAGVPAPGARVASGGRGALQPQLIARVSTFLDGVTVQAVSGLPPLEGVTGSFVFDAGRLQRSTLTGSWLGGPVTLHVGERRERATRVLAIQAQGTLNAHQLSTLANATGTVDGSTDWNGELAYLQTEGSSSPRWRMRADSNLLGVVSSLPEPFAKRSTMATPVHLEVTGSNDSAQLRASFGDRMRTLLALKRKAAVGWAVDKGAVRFDSAVPVLPADQVVMVRGRVSQLDLPAYAIAWQRLRQDSLPTIRAQVVANQMLVGDRRYDEVSLQAERTNAGTNLLLDSAAVAGIVRWPAPDKAARSRGATIEPQSAELHFTRLDLPDGTLPGDGVGLVAALAPSAVLAVDELNWRGRSLGRLTATMNSRDKVVSVDDAHLVNGTHAARGTLHCQTAMPTCRLTFTVDSTDAAATLEDFGFEPDLTASAASLSGEAEWRPAPGQPWLAGVQGTLTLRLADGTLRPVGAAQSVDTHAAAYDRSAGRGAEAHADGAEVARSGRGSDAHSGADGTVADGGSAVGTDMWARNASGADGDVWARTASAPGGDVWAGTAAGMGAERPHPQPFALLAVPALVNALDAPGAAGASLTKEQPALHFDHLEADFDLADGQATTSNLHFDGDAEILMRGRIGIVSRDYDQQVWLLRGEERLPAAVRRFGATPRVAAAWLSLRDLFGSGGSQDRSRAVLRLQGTWDDPMVVTAN